MRAEELIQRYYTAFNAQDTETFLSLLTDDVIHDINQGGRAIGRDAAEFTVLKLTRNLSTQPGGDGSACIR